AHLVLRAGDDEVGVPESVLLGLDAATDAVLVLDLVARHARGAQRPLLVAPQRVAGEDERPLPTPRELLRHVAGVGVVPVHDVGDARTLLDAARGDRGALDAV